MPSGSIGSIWIDLRARSDELRKEVGAAMAHTERSLKASGARMARIGTGFAAGVTAPLVGLGAAAVKVAGDFESAMREVNSLTNLPQAQFEAFSKEVRELSVEMGVGLTDSAKAMYQAISAGVPRENAVDFLRVATRSAIAGVTETEVAVDGLTTVLNAFKKPMEEAEQVADLMFTAVKRGKTTMGELGSSMNLAAPIAAELGVSFEELAAGVATLTKSGVPTAQAMTQIRAAINSLATPNQTMFELLEKTGFASGRALIEAKGLAGAIDTIRTAADGSDNVLGKAFGSVEALGFALGVTGRNAEVFQEDLAAMTGAAGAMQTAFEENDKGFSRSMARMKAAFAGLADAVATSGLLDFAERLVTQIGELAKRASAADPMLLKIGLAAAAAAASIGPFLIALGAITTGIGAVVGALPALGAIAAIGAVWGAVAAVVVTNWERIKTAYLEWREENKDLLAELGAAWQDLRKSFAELGSALLVVMKEIAKAFEDAFGTSILQAIKDFASFFLFFLADAIRDLATMARWLKDVITDLDNLGRKFQLFRSIVSTMTGGGVIPSLPEEVLPPLTPPPAEPEPATQRSGPFGLLPPIPEPPPQPGELEIRSPFDLLPMPSADLFTMDNRGTSSSPSPAIDPVDALDAYEQGLIESGIMPEMGGTMAQQTADAFSESLPDTLSAAVAEIPPIETPSSLPVIAGVGDDLARGIAGTFREAMLRGKLEWESVAGMLADVFVTSLAKDIEAGLAEAFKGFSFGAISGGDGGGGGFLSSLGKLFGLPSFDGGGYTGDGPRGGGVDGRGGFPALLHPRETVIPDGVGGSNAAGGNPVTVNYHFAPGVTRQDLAALLPELERRTADGVLEAVMSGGAYRRGMQA